MNIISVAYSKLRFGSFKFTLTGEMPRFGKPSGVPQLGVSEGKARDTAAHCSVLQKRKKERGKRERE